MAQALRKIGSLVFGNGLMVPSSRARAHGGVVAPAKLSASGDVAEVLDETQRLAAILEIKKVLSFGAGEC